MWDGDGRRLPVQFVPFQLAQVNVWQVLTAPEKPLQSARERMDRLFIRSQSGWQLSATIVVHGRASRRGVFRRQVSAVVGIVCCVRDGDAHQLISARPVGPHGDLLFSRFSSARSCRTGRLSWRDSTF